MEFGGVLGLDGLLGSSIDHNHSVGGGGPCLFSMNNSTPTTELPMKQRSLFGGFLKHGRSASAGGQEQQVDWRSLKLARTARSTTTTEQMLSFSTSSASKPEQYASLYHLNSHDGYHNHYYPYSSSQSSASAAHSSFRSTAGLGCGSRNVSSSHGPFTPSQWMELEHQALIYKYMDANIPVPSSLLVPFRRSTNPSPLSPFLSGSTTLGWGPFHLGFSGNGDPEPGRCRRSDGKKWRCSRDVVADQKYCERHVNRGRHRSRKHVEGQSGQASKPVPTVASPPQRPAYAFSGGGIGGSSNKSTLRIITSQQTGSLMQPNEPSPPRNDRIQMSKEKAKYHDRDSNGGLSPLEDASPKPLDSLFLMSKHQNPFEATISRPEFGLINTSEPLGLNRVRTSYSDDDDDVGFHSASKLKDGQPQQQHPLLHFIDDWPKAQSELPSLAWPKIDEMKSSDRRTQLSISIPSNISSSSSLSSPLRPSREFNPTSGGNQRRGAGWIPISREPPTIGGPLGEVLNNKTNTTPNRDSSPPPPLNLLLADGWDASPRLMQSSPTGVLQKSSSTGSSPRA